MKNVIHDNGEELIPTHIDHTYRVILGLRRLLPNFSDYLFIVYNHNGKTLPISRNFWHGKKILFWEGGECKRQEFDQVCSDYLYVFANYVQSRQNIHSIPLGYFSNEVSGYVKMSERLFGVSFMGCLNRNRVQLASLLTGKPKQWISLGLLKRKKQTLKVIDQLAQHDHPQDYFHFTEDFDKGFPKERYSFILQNSRVALCPRGWVNTETFRMYEGMKMGCAVITEKLPERDYYKDIPVIQVKRWDHGLEIARQLVENEDELVGRAKACKQFYNKHFSPVAVAKDIAAKINEETA